MRTPALLLVVIVSLWTAPIQTQAQPTGEALSIVQIVVYSETDHMSVPGTGFIVDSSGTTITSSHVVQRAIKQPDRYVILVLYEGTAGKEFFTAELACATTLHLQDSGQPYEKDAAILHIVAPTTSYRSFGSSRPGDRWTRHEGPLPTFPVLRVADHGAPIGARVHIPGYAPGSSIHIASGRIEATSTARDGTPLLRLQYYVPPQPGDSGAPVLDEHGDVVGLFTWERTSQGLAVVRHPCERRP